MDGGCNFAMEETMRAAAGWGEERKAGIVLVMRRGGDRDPARARDSARVKKKMIDMQGAKPRQYSRLLLLRLGADLTVGRW
jgi:hypothetical protein